MNCIPAHAFERDRLQSQKHISLKIYLFWGGRVVLVNSLGIAPALLDEIAFAVKLWEEYDFISLCFTDDL